MNPNQNEAVFHTVHDSVHPDEGSGSYEEVDHSGQSDENLVQAKIHSDTLPISEPFATSSRTSNTSSSANISGSVDTPETISPQPHSEASSVIRLSVVTGEECSPNMGSIVLVPDSGESDLDNSMDSPQG